MYDMWLQFMTAGQSKDFLRNMSKQNLPLSVQALVWLQVQGILDYVNPLVRSYNIAVGAGLNLDDALGNTKLPGELRAAAFLVNALKFGPKTLEQVTKLHQWSVEQATKLGRFSMAEIRADALNRRAVVRAMQKGAFLHQRRLEKRRPLFAKRKTRFKRGEKIGREEDEEIYQ